MTRTSLLPLLQAVLLATMPGFADAHEVKPNSEAQAAEYKLDTSFYKKGVLVQDILIATSQKVADHTIPEAAYQFVNAMKTIKPDVAGRKVGRGRSAEPTLLPKAETRLTGPVRPTMGSATGGMCGGVVHGCFCNAVETIRVVSVTRMPASRS